MTTTQNNENEQTAKDYREEGRQAYLTEQARTSEDCPYSLTSPGGQAWLEGLNAAIAETL